MNHFNVCHSMIKRNSFFVTAGFTENTCGCVCACVCLFKLMAATCSRLPLLPLSSSYSLLLLLSPSSCTCPLWLSLCCQSWRCSAHAAAAVDASLLGNKRTGNVFSPRGGNLCHFWFLKMDLDGGLREAKACLLKSAWETLKQVSWLSFLSLSFKLLCWAL